MSQFHSPLLCHAPSAQSAQFSVSSFYIMLLIYMSVPIYHAPHIHVRTHPPLAQPFSKRMRIRACSRLSQQMQPSSEKVHRSPWRTQSGSSVWHKSAQHAEQQCSRVERRQRE